MRKKYEEAIRALYYSRSYITVCEEMAPTMAGKEVHGMVDKCIKDYEKTILEVKK